MDPYNVLGVGADATPEQITAARKQRSRETHPDAGGDEEEFKSVQRAFGILIDPQARAYYDRTGDDSKPRQEEIVLNQAVQYTAQLLDAFINSGDSVEYTNVPAKLVRSALREKGEVERRLADARKKLARLEGFSGRLSRKKGRSQAGRVRESKDKAVLNNAIEIHRRGLKAVIDDCELGIKVRDKAIAMLERHDYRVDERPAPTTDPRSVMVRAFGGDPSHPFFR